MKLESRFENFTKELKELLTKYNCELELATPDEDTTIEVYFKSKFDAITSKCIEESGFFNLGRSVCPPEPI